MSKVIVEVGSTNTKIDLYDGKTIKRLEEITITFKKNYSKNNEISKNDINILINKILDLKKQYNDIYICGTSIFRNLQNEEKEAFLADFKEKTGFEFNIISSEKENELTVIGATRFVNEKVCVFVGGGGSTEISIYDKKITKSENTSIGVMDIMNKFPDLANDYATTPLEEVMDYIEDRLKIPDDKADILILAGGGHKMFVEGSGIKYEKNILYTDDASPIIEDIETRIKETKRYFEEISLDAIRSRVSNPDWWYATRAMCAFVLVVSKHIKAKYIVPTNIAMVYGLLNEKNANNKGDNINE